MAERLHEHYCPLCNTLGETRMILSKEKGVLKVRLEKDDVVSSLKEQMAKCYGYNNGKCGTFLFGDSNIALGDNYHENLFS